MGELQEIAKTLNIPKYRSLKKLDLVYQILDSQASNPKTIPNDTSSEKPKEENTPKVQKVNTRIKRPRTRKTEESPNNNVTKPQTNQTGNSERIVTKKEPTPPKTEEKQVAKERIISKPLQPSKEKNIKISQSEVPHSNKNKEEKKEHRNRSNEQKAPNKQ